MPELLSNTPSQNYTVTQDGRNVVPAIKSKSHFFIESNGVGAFQQVVANKFGVISDTIFRTTAGITFTGTKEVYAICQGQVFVQPQTGSITKVNLILRPYVQPIVGLSIKYFIYRGLDKSDFISGTGATAIVAGSETSGTGFTKHIWKEFNSFFTNDESSDPVPPFVPKMIGYSEGIEQADTDLIDQYFFKLTLYDGPDEDEEIEDTAYELPMAKKGMHLGNATVSVGLDIVINNGDYYIENDINPFQLNLAFARQSNGLLDTDAGDTDYKKKLIRECCTQFIDPASFYGLHANGHGKLFINENTTPLIDFSDIYNHVQNFATKDTLYIYIQSNRQRSYNFYGNYSLSDVNPNDIQIGADENSLAEAKFGEQTWPIHIIDNSTEVYLQLTTDNHTQAALYVQYGVLKTQHELNFVRNQNLLQNPADAIDLNYTQKLGFNMLTDGTNNISTCLQLVYNGKQMLVPEYVAPPAAGEDPIEPKYFILKEIDDLFGLVNAKSFIQPKSELELPTLLDEKIALLNFPRQQNAMDVGILKTKRIHDAIRIDDENVLKRVTYETLLFNINNDSSTHLQSNSSSIDKISARTSNFSKEQNNFYQPALPYLLRPHELFDNEQTISLLILDTTDNNIPTKKILGISEYEFESLLNVIILNSVNNARLFFKNQTIYDNNQLLIEEKKFNNYQINIIAENTLGELNIYSLTDLVEVYSADGIVFASKAYTDNLPEINTNAFFIKLEL